VLIPKENEKDLAEIPDNVKRGLTLISIATVDEVLENAMTTKLTPIEWDEKAELEASRVANTTPDDEDVGGLTTH
jgi:ATP-dependent Lon protease